MIGLVCGSLLIVVSLVSLVLQRLYSCVPARELRRLAKRGDHLAAALYRPVAYGPTLRMFLWAVVGLSLSAGLMLVLPELPTLAGFGLLLFLILLSFVIVPSMRLTLRAAQFAAALAPGVVKVLYYLHAPFDRAAMLVGRYRELQQHSRLYEKHDLQELLQRQEEQVDNRIHDDELQLVRQALAFDDKQAEDIVQSRSSAHLVDADATIGPVLLDNLHKSGQSSFLVYKDEKDNIVGSLAMRDAVAAKQGGRVFDLVRSDLTFINEDFSLRQVLGAFQNTGHTVGVVINKFEEFRGVITMSDVLKELLGDPELAVENYEDKVAVAGYEPKDLDKEADLEPGASSDVSTQEPSDTEEPTSPEATEVVE